MYIEGTYMDGKTQRCNSVLSRYYAQGQPEHRKECLTAPERPTAASGLRTPIATHANVSARSPAAPARNAKRLTTCARGGARAPSAIGGATKSASWPTTSRDAVFAPASSVTCSAAAALGERAVAVAGGSDATIVPMFEMTISACASADVSHPVCGKEGGHAPRRELARKTRRAARSRCSARARARSLGAVPCWAQMAPRHAPRRGL